MSKRGLSKHHTWPVPVPLLRVWLIHSIVPNITENFLGNISWYGLGRVLNLPEKRIGALFSGNTPYKGHLVIVPISKNISNMSRISPEPYIHSTNGPSWNQNFWCISRAIWAFQIYHKPTRAKNTIPYFIWFPHLTENDFSMKRFVSREKFDAAQKYYQWAVGISCSLRVMSGQISGYLDAQEPFNADSNWTAGVELVGLAF